MKKLKFILLFALIAIFYSCQKDNDLNVTLKTAGVLKIQIKDSLGNTYPNVKVRIFSYVSQSMSGLQYEGEIDTRNTDINGSINFGLLNQGFYYVVCDTIRIGTKVFYPYKGIQIVTGETKNIVLNPTESVGKAKIYISINGIDTITKTNLRIALIRSDDYKPNLNRQTVLKNAVAIQKVNSDGTANFDNIPSDISYIPFCYYANNDTTGAFPSDNFSSYFYLRIYKNEKTTASFSFDATDLFVLKGNINLNIYYYGYKNGSYGNWSVTNANVILVEYSDYNRYLYYNSSLSDIKLYASGEGTTDVNGNVSFSNVKANISYTAFVYYSSNTNARTWYNYYFNINYGNNPIKSIEVDEYSLSLN
jgi:hypothetical protein